MHRLIFFPSLAQVSNLVHAVKEIDWAATGIILLIFAMPVLAISLPSVILPGIRSMNVTSLQTPIYAESSRATLLDENNWTKWSSNQAQSGTALNYSNNGLLLSGSFPASTEPLAFSISRSLDVNLTEYPIIYMLIEVSKGSSYGVRLYSQSSGSTTPLWSESDALNHRSGTGEAENLQLNVPQIIQLNTGKIFDSISGVTVYVERSPSPNINGFSLLIGKFEFLNFPLISAGTVGSYHGIYVGLNQIQTDPSLSLQSVLFQGRMNASTGAVLVPYFVEGIAAYPGAVIRIGTTTKDLSITIPITSQSAMSFSDNLPTQKVAIVLIAASGTLTQLIVNKVSLNYYSRTAQTLSIPSQSRNTLVASAFFFLLLPASIIVLIYGQLRRNKAAKTTP